MTDGSCCSTFGDASISLFWALVCLWMLSALSSLFFNVPRLPIIQIPLHIFHFFSLENRTNQTCRKHMHALISGTKKKNKTIVHWLGNVDPKISESPPAVFSLAPRLRCRFRGYVIYVYADMCISQHSRQLSWAEFSCFGPRHCLLARWAVKSRTLCHRGPAAVWKRVRL